MPTPIKMGITGGIGTGKTYICNLFKSFHIPVFNTDDEVKSDIIRREIVKKQVVAEFGDDSYLEDGSINRDKFRKILFTSFNHRTRMNEIVTSELLDSINKWAETQIAPYVLIECAVLFENSIDKHLDGVIVVTCPKELRVERLLKRGVAQKDIDNIMSAQWSEEQKIKLADYQIQNYEGIECMVEELDNCLRHYAKGFRKAMAQREAKRL